MTTLHEVLRWITGITLLPTAVWVVKTEIAYRKAEKESEIRQKLRVPRLLLILYTAFQVVYSAAYIVKYDFSTYLAETILLTLFLGFPLTVLTVLIPVVVRYLRCPKDAPERIVLKRKLLTAGVVCGILIAVFAAFMIWFLIGIAHM